MQPPMVISNEAERAAASEGRDLAAIAVARAGALLAELAEEATSLAGLLAEQGRSRNLASVLCRRAELAGQLGRKLARVADSRPIATTTLLNDAILSLDGIAVDVEYASDFANDVVLRNQVARARLAVTTTGCSLEDALRALAARR